MGKFLRMRRRLKNGNGSTSPDNGHREEEEKEEKQEANRDVVDIPISASIRENQEWIKGLFADCSDIVFRELVYSHQVQGLLVYIDGIVNAQDVQDHALRPILNHFLQKEDKVLTPETLVEHEISLAQLSHVASYSEVVEGVLHGNAALFIEGHQQAIVLNSRGGTRRGVEEPASESVIRGPREGFTENLRVNTSLVRFKIKSSKLRTISLTIGDKTLTNVVLCYLDDVADPRVIQEVRHRLNEIKIDSVLESAYIEELIEDEPFSPFPQLQHTERPDTVAANLLEGRFAIFVDGTPFVLIGPITFWQFLQASEDYYERYLISSLLRWLRFLFLFLALYLPALYIAVTTYHQDMLPTNLLLSVATARESIPFPALVEALIMEISFEALREAGIRLPKFVGQAVSILGALVIGQAAVQAGIVSAPMVIIVSLTGIASFTIPRYNAAIAIRMLRFPLMFLAGTFGLYGILVGTIWIATHMCKLRSFGVPYLSGVSPMSGNEQKDLLVRVPWWAMVSRPKSFSDRNAQRMKAGMRPEPPRPEEGSGS